MQGLSFHKILLYLLAIIAIAAPLHYASATPSSNKGYELQTTGSNHNLWGVTLNNNFSAIDRNIGGRISYDVSGSSNITVSASNAQYLYHKLTGTLTGNIQYILPDAGGLYVIENATSGAFSLTVDNAPAGTGVVVPQGFTMLVYDNADDNAVVNAITYITGFLLPGNNLSDVSNAATAFTNIKQAATEGASGACQLATTGEAATGTNTTKCTTAAGVAAAIAALTPSTNGVPPGTVFYYAGSTPPTGYFEGYGEAVSRTTYSNLFAAIGTVYGTGDGTTTFNVPDCRGRFIAGEDDMGGTAAGRLTNSVSGGVDGSTLGATGGEEKHTLTSSEIPPVSVTIPARTTGSLGGANIVATPASNTTMTATTAGGGGAHNLVPPTIVMKCIVKF